MKKITALLLIVILCSFLFACGKNSEIEGTWRTYDLGVSIDSPELPSYFTFTFHKNGTGTGPVGSFDRLDTTAFTYEVMDGGFIKVVTDEQDELVMTYTFSGENMILEFNGYSRVLEKVSDDVIIECY